MRRAGERVDRNRRFLPLKLVDGPNPCVRQALLINGTAYAASVVFMSLGTLVYPGLGTTIGAILADCTPLLLGL